MTNPMTPTEQSTKNLKPETNQLTVRVKALSQSDIRIAWNELEHLAMNEAAPEKNAALRRVADALWDITNFSGVEAIASAAIVEDEEYMGKPQAEPSTSEDEVIKLADDFRDSMFADAPYQIKWTADTLVIVRSLLAQRATGRDNAREEKLLSVVFMCQKQFQFYAENHRKAGKDDKAQTNQDFAEMCQQVLALKTPQSSAVREK